MRFYTIFFAVVAAHSAFVAADSLNWNKVVHDVAAAVKETGDHASEAISKGSAHAMEVIDDLEKGLKQMKGPLTDAVKSAVEEAHAALKDAVPKVGAKMKEGAEAVHEVMVEVAAVIQEALNHAADTEDGANKELAPGVVSISLDANDIDDPKENNKEDAIKCGIPCPRIYLPVCGSDGRTHSNRCEMERFACESDSKLEVVHLGKCKGPSERPKVQTDPCWRACTEDKKPVCGSDGKTYPNECFFKIESCHMGGEGMLSIKNQGECEDIRGKTPQACMKACTRDYRPLCATNGKTYSNKCMFEIAQCMLKFDAIDIEVAYLGKCGPSGQPCPQFCTMDYKPVCGSDGQTYGNLCSLRSKACKSPELQLTTAYNGECKDNTEAPAANSLVAGRNNAGIIASVTSLSVLALLAAVLAVVAARRMRTRQEDLGAAPPPYSKLLTEDADETDPDELFHNSYGAKHSYTQL